MTQDLETALEGALLGTFAGDAVGRPFEGSHAVERDEAERRLAAVLEHGSLRYTDDTQLAFALAAHLALHPDVEPRAFAATILDYYEPHRGYGGGMHAIIEAWRGEVPLDRAAEVRFEGGSFGNGAAMRVAPLAVLHATDPARLDEAVERASALTHAHPVGIDGAAVQAHAVAVATRWGRFARDELEQVSGAARTDALRGPLRGALRLLDTDGDPDLPSVAQRLGNAVVAQRSVPTALWAAASASDLVDAVVRALGIAGDTDTIAAMAAAVRGAAEGPGAVPAAWLERMERGPRGVDHVGELVSAIARE